jgi:hypothetical protein
MPARYGITLVTSGSLVEFEDWLDEASAEKWEMIFLGIGEKLHLKKVQITFASMRDKDNFIANRINYKNRQLSA